MPHHERAADPQDRFTSPDAIGPTASMPALDLAAALGGLDRATRNFTRRLGEAQGQSNAPPHPAPRPPSPSAPDPRLNTAASPPPSTGKASAEQAFEARLRDAEREAREYLERAKQRADSLVAAMVGAVEHEAAGIRRDAEEGIRARWHQVEIDAGRHLEEARRVSNGMVAERQQQLAVLSDGITGRAEALCSGLDDADRVRMQFDAFVKALSLTAGRIAADSRAARGAAPGSSGEIHDLRRHPRPSALAA